MAKFTVKGEVDQGNEWRKFTKEVEATNEKHAREVTLAGLGSTYGVRRSKVKITEIKKGGKG